MRGKLFGEGRGIALGMLAAVLLVAPGLCAQAQAAPPQLWDACEAEAPEGQGCSIPRGVAAYLPNGRLFVADQVNRRVVELNARGEFLKAWGWDVIDGGGTEFEICVPEDGDTCQSGSFGEGSGQFGFEGPQGVAVDSAGGVYVVDRGLPSNARVQKFDSDGNFVLMFGGDVNKTKVEEAAPEAQRNLCSAASGDACQKGTQGTGSGQFGAWLAIGDWIDIDTKGTPTDADDLIYVGDRRRIQVFDTEGNYLNDVPLDPEGALKDRAVEGLAVDGDGDLYAIYSGLNDARKVNPATGKELPSPRYPIDSPEALTVDGEGNVYAFRTPVIVGQQRHPLFKFDPEGGEAIEEFGQGEFNSSTGLATNVCPGSEAPGNLYVTNASDDNAFVRAYGTEPVGCFKARTLPAEPIEELAATLNGTVDPKGEAIEECFFRWGQSTAYEEAPLPCTPGPGAIGSGSEPVPVSAELSGLARGTVYHFRLIVRAGGETEPGSDEAFKTRGPPVISGEHVQSASDTEATLRGLVNPEGFATTCHFEYVTEAEFKASGFEAAQSTAEKPVEEERSDHVVSASLNNLDPGAAYRWRIVCVNFSDTTEGQAFFLATFVPGTQGGDCSNAAFRTGAGAFLPDCRAYEMVSPVDKNGGNILLYNEGYVQATPEGDKLTYSTIPSFGEAQNSWTLNQYLAERTERDQAGEGWSTHGIHPPVVGREAVDVFGAFGSFADFNAFTQDLCMAWIWDYLNPPTPPEGQQGKVNLYLRNNCEPGKGTLETLIPEPPPLPMEIPDFYVDAESVQGISDDGKRTALVAHTPILPDCRTTTAAEAVSYQWLRNGEPIPGATSPVYSPVAADAGSALQCQVFGINANTGSTQVANPAVVIPPEAGVETFPPVAPGSIPAPPPANPFTGTVLNCATGSWGEASSFSYQWYVNGAAVPGAAGETYEVQAADVPGSIQCAVTGENADGAVAKVSGNRLTSPLPSPLPSGVNAIMDRDVSRVYVRDEGVLNLASVLPGGRVGASDSGIGSGWRRSLDNAVSTDGSRVFWMIGFEVDLGFGRIFLRDHAEQGIVSKECTGSSAACTVQVSAGSEAFFWTAAADGAKALYSEGNLFDATAELFEFDLNEGGEPKTRSVAKRLEGVLGASEDLSRVYFVSRENLDGGAVDGEPNLYLDDGGVVTFLGVLAEGDVGVLEPDGNDLAYDLASRITAKRATRVSPDGSRLVLQSRARLTGYDNTDRNNGKADVEVFAYDADAKELDCISCNPSGARPVGRELLKRYWAGSGGISGVFAAAWIPGWEKPLHASNVVSADGERIFFNSNDALLPRDTNATMDVYQWQAPGKGSCEEDSSSYFPQNGGCIDLISSGQSPFESEFWEASESGNDVFFTTESSLVGKDPGLVDLYDARVNGGFPEAEEREACEGEACQSPPPPPEQGTPSSSTYQGPGDPKPRPGCGAAAKRAAKLSRQARRARRAARRSESSKASRRLRRRAKGAAKRARRLSRSAKRCRRANRRAQR